MSNGIKDGKTINSDNLLDEAQDDRIIICLTDREPVRVSQTVWPLLTQASMPIYRIDQRKADSSLFEAIKASLAPTTEWLEHNCPGDEDRDWIEQSRYVFFQSMLHIYVRKHADGRVLIYGTRTRTNQRNKPGRLADSLGGEILDIGKDLKSALDQYAKVFIDMCGGCSADAPRKLVEACLSRMPPEDFDNDKAPKGDSDVIVLSGGNPIKVSKSEWPSITDVESPIYYDYYTEEDGGIIGVCKIPIQYGYERLNVRQHHDGRAIVSGGVRFEEEWASQFNIFNMRGGEVVDAGEDLVAHIKHVGLSLNLRVETIRACINGLPAKDLD